MSCTFYMFLRPCVRIINAIDDRTECVSTFYTDFVQTKSFGYIWLHLGFSVLLFLQANKVKVPCYHHAGAKQRYSSYLFLTSAQEGGECSASCSSCALPLEKGLWHPLDRRVNGPQRLEERSYNSYSSSSWGNVHKLVLLKLQVLWKGSCKQGTRKRGAVARDCTPYGATTWQHCISYCIPRLVDKLIKMPFK
jgi:hypothetical protein